MFLVEAFDVYKNYRQYRTSLVDIKLLEDDAKETLNFVNSKDKNLLLYVTIKEWWAELCTGYLEFPKAFSVTASEQEKQLIQKWLLKKDPNFDAIKAREKRHFVWNKAKSKIYSKLVQRGMDADVGLRKKQKR